ncbi:MAG: ribonuclease HI family protein [Dehalococcoidia bacterium]
MPEGFWVVYADGASRGNPGPAAIGAVILNPAGQAVHHVSQRIGRATNNVAEYRAAIAGLEAALALAARQVELRMDSELVVRQVEGRYRVRNPALKKLFARMQGLRSRFDSFQARAIPRSENRLADGLANAALDGP